VLALGAGDIRGVLPGNGVLIGLPWDAVLSSEKILPMDDRGFCIVRSNPVIAAFSSDPSPLSVSYDDVDFRVIEDSPSPDRRWVISGRLKVDFSGGCTGEGETGRGASAASCFSAIAETAASTLTSNSSSEMVKVVRSKFSMNCIAPIYQKFSAWVWFRQNLSIFTKEDK